MNILLTANLVLFNFILIPSQLFAKDLKRINLIPKPQSVIEKEGEFKWEDKLPIYTNKAFKPVADLFAEEAFLSPIAISSSKIPANTKAIVFIKAANVLNKNIEAYQLIITPNQIKIIAATNQGALMGMFTLLQLQLIQSNKNVIPCAEIVDTPRFAYRGLHLDVSRNFMPINFIKKTIDLMALYKLNTFHWHLTDGAGWRLQIFKYPKLTTEAAFRTNNSWKEWSKSGRKYLREGAPNAYGGYYTQVEAKAMVAYAAKRGITIIPEIEMPGHSEEVTAVYPNLACSGKPYTQSEFCIGNDSTFIFLQDVLTEVMQVFPSKYIHIGGDEANKTAWKTCPKCQARIKNESLKDEHELQSYAIRRMEKFLTAHGRKLLGWDEILEGGLAPAATVMSWRGEAGGIAAAKAGHDVIMTPGGYCYFDAYQADPLTQPDAIGGFLPLSKVYSYEPIPAELNATEAKYVLGAQANVWTEYMPTTEHVEYMIFPRLLALSEVLWTGKQNKNWDDFQQRLQQQYTLLQRKSINYYRPIPNLEIKTLADTVQKASIVTIISEQYQPDIRYTLNGSEPDSNSIHYDNPFLVKGMEMVKAAIFNRATNKMEPITEKLTVYHKAVGAKITYHLPYNKRYAAQGNYTLLNGQQGGYSYNDGQWQGFLNDLDVTIELPQLTDVNKISISFMQLIGPGVYMPKFVEYSWSENGQDYSAPVQVVNAVSDAETKLIVKPFETSVNKPIKYIHIKAKNSRGFLFADEILVN